MRNLILALSLFVSVQTFAQLGQRCPICPPKQGSAANGYCLTIVNGVAVWAPCGDAADSIFWHTSNGDLYPANTALNVGVGTSNPTTKLHVAGSFRLVDGTQTQGSVLTSDASGNAAWGRIVTGSIGSNTSVGYGINIADSAVQVFIIDTVSNESAGLTVMYSTADGVKSQLAWSDGVNSGSTLTAMDTGAVMDATDGSNTRTITVTPTYIKMAMPSVGLGKVLISDAAGKATWQTLSSASGVGIPAYANNAAAFAAIGAGKLYYTDTGGEYILKLSH